MCRHLAFVIRDGDFIGKAYCPTCNQTVPLSEAFNNLAAAMRASIERADQIVEEARSRLPLSPPGEQQESR